MSLAVRTTGNPMSVASGVAIAVRQVDSESPVVNVISMNDLVSNSLAPQRSNLFLLAAFAGLALVLTAVGVYSVLSYTVRRRVREIGIRMALGAKRTDVLRMIVAHGVKMAIAGVLLGIIGAVALTRLMAQLVYQTSTTDIATFFATGACVLIFILLACYVPSLRATRVDPNVALRCE